MKMVFNYNGEFHQTPMVTGMGLEPNIIALKGLCTDHLYEPARSSPCFAIVYFIVVHCHKPHIIVVPTMPSVV